MESRKYPLSTSSFERIRTENYLYIDKTSYLHSLINEGVYYFLARPRRFGKSLLISTLEAYFRGKRELFDGLDIDRLQPGEWETYPVVHLDLSGDAYTDKESLLYVLASMMMKWERELGITDVKLTVAQRFQDIISTLASITGKRVVVLIDEYDSPLSSAIDNPELLQLYCDQLHGFYSVLKAMDNNIQFCMLTGVTKFGKVSVFSGLNNMHDITFEDRYAGICGITENELHTYLYDGIKHLADTISSTVDEAFSKLKFYYDGYHFSECLLDIYNPYSVLYCLSQSKLKDYWCASGMPTLLSKSLKRMDYDLEKLNGAIVSSSMLDNLSVFQTDPVSLFYQTGYLTIKNYDQTTELYTLGYPNREVEQGVMNDILKVYTLDSTDVRVTITLMKESLKNGKPEKFISILKSFFAGIPSKLRRHVGEYENYYHTIFYCIASLIGLDINVEYNTSEGYIDILIQTTDYIYVIELKINGTSADAISQIDKVHYTDQFENDSRKIFKVGIGFSKTSHNIDSFLII